MMNEIQINIPTEFNLNMSQGSMITAQQISDFEQFRREKREKLTLYQRPLDTILVFSRAVYHFVLSTIRYSLSHGIFLYLVLPILIVWIVLEYIPGPYSPYIDQIEFYVEYIIWWVGLGILSSIGLGSGLQSGVLFLFPHIIRTCLAAQTCKTVDFESATNIWFRSPKNLFKCPEPHHDLTPVTFFNCWKKIIVVCFLQSAGTAIGEIPPYWMTRAARLAAIEAGTSRPSDIPEELESNSKYSIINRSKKWMIWFLNTHGFYGVLLMASFPNIAFDLCGICCGHFMMPFWTFFLPTFIGKAIIRNSYQSVLYVLMCSEEYLEIFIRLLQRLTPDALHLDQAIREVLEEGRESFRNIGNTSNQSNRLSSDHSKRSGEVFMFWWQIFMATLLLAFLLSCISQFAQYYQMTIDQDESNQLKKLLPPHVRKELISPTSGRIRLPPPSSHKSNSLGSLSSSEFVNSSDSLLIPPTNSGSNSGSNAINLDPNIIFNSKGLAGKKE